MITTMDCSREYHAVTLRRIGCDSDRVSSKWPSSSVVELALSTAREDSTRIRSTACVATSSGRFSPFPINMTTTDQNGFFVVVVACGTESCPSLSPSGMKHLDEGRMQHDPTLRNTAQPEMKALFRPCIDLRRGRVTQIVGSTLADNDDASDSKQSAELENFATDESPAHFAALYRKRALPGGHVIMLDREEATKKAALAALSGYPGGLQVGGGVTPDNARDYLDAGASHVIVTSYVFKDGAVAWDRLAKLVDVVGRDHLVLDLSCRRRPRRRDGAAADGSAADAASENEEQQEFVIVTDRWQKFTDVVLNKQTLATLAEHCAEFLVHGVDVEGKQQGVDMDLVHLLAEHSPIPVTYAGGVRSLDDVRAVVKSGGGRVAITVGSALDIFGGPVAFDDVVEAAKLSS
eukprot:TRINITY_DN49027_c0_g1_i2.p1 TRINITY_DN49027_c0_g1~~TRINITY_DN49027_c0_g1_i2.p1  ORF type:complete len:406 (-),score=169.67 TRINITY_DN49027_c0_g1_i2:41-1258(-)